MSGKRYFGFADFASWVRDQVSGVTDLLNAKLGSEDTAVNSQRLEGKTLAEVIGRITNGEVSFGASAVAFDTFHGYRYNATGQGGELSSAAAVDAGFNMVLASPNEQGELVFQFDGQGSFNASGSVYGRNSQGVYEDYETTLLEVPGNKLQHLTLRFAPTEIAQMRVTANSIAGVGQDGFYFVTGSESKALYEGDPYEFTLDPNAESGYTNEQENARNINFLQISAFKGSLNAIAHLSQVSLVLEQQINGEWVNVFAGGAGGLSLVSLEQKDTALAQRVQAVENDKLNSDAQAVDSAKLEGKTLSEIVASIVGGGSGPLAVKIDCGAGWTNSSNIQLKKLSFFKSTEPETVFAVDLSLITSELGSLYYNNGFLELSSLNYEQSITITNFGAVPEGVDRMVIELEQLYVTTGVISVIDNESPEVVYGTFDFDATLGQSVDNEYSDTFEVSFDRPAAEPVVGLTLAGLNSDLDALEGRVSDVELNKLDADAQAVDSALLEGRSVADLTASDVEATSGVVTDKFMTPSTSKAAFDARWAEKVGTAPETLDTIEELATALRNTPDALAALEAMAKEYTDTEVLAAITQLSGVDMPAGTTLASVMLAITALQTGKLDSAAQAVDSAKLEGKTLAEIITQIMGEKGSEGLTLNSLEARLTVTEEAVETLGTSKLDATAQSVDSAKLGGKSLSEVIDLAIQPGRLFYPVVHVNGNVDQPDYVMPTPAEVWAQVKTNAVLEQVDTVYAIGVRRLHPGNLLALTGQEGISLVGAVSQAQEGPTYVVMRANVEASVWEVVNEPMLGCLARLSKHCVVVGENTERFVPGQTLFYNGFEALSEGVYYDWTVLADKEWEVVPTTDSELLIDSARYHRTEIRIQSVGPVVINVDVEADLPFEMELRVVNMTGVSVTFAGANITSSPRMEEYAMTKVNGVVRVVRHTNTAVSVAGDLDEAFFANPEYV